VTDVTNGRTPYKGDVEEANSAKTRANSLVHAKAERALAQLKLKFGFTQARLPCCGRGRVSTDFIRIARRTAVSLGSSDHAPPAQQDV
jgi:hypothetical protein